MWELIRANKRKSLTLFLAMGICLILLGYFIGAVFFAGNGAAGVFAASFLWIIMSAVSFFAGDSIILAASKAREVTYDVHPQLFNVVEEMKIAANLPAMPKIYIIPDAAPNAFATGRKPERSAITVTAGLLSKLNRDELQGVVAHEMSHIINRDVLFMTFAGVMLGSIVILSQLFLRGMWYSGSSRRYSSRRSSGGGGQAQLIIMAASVIFAILAPILARLLYFSISRKREYLADASAARLTRYPEGLALALEKISASSLDLASANKATAPLYIANPLKKKGRRLSNLSSTHPPISERIEILRKMSQGVNFASYQDAYSLVKGKTSAIIPASGLRDKKAISVREAYAGREGRKGKREEMRDVGDLMRAVNKYIFLVCACGLKMKIPPHFEKSKIACPRCGRENEIPIAELALAAGAISSSDKAKKIKGSMEKLQ